MLDREGARLVDRKLVVNKSGWQVRPNGSWLWGTELRGRATVVPSGGETALWLN